MALTPAEKLLKEVNLSLTRQRVAVLELFLKEEHPMTPHEVRERLEDQEHVDQVTIYRVLEALARTRLLTQVPSTDPVLNVIKKFRRPTSEFTASLRSKKNS